MKHEVDEVRFCKPMEEISRELKVQIEEGVQLSKLPVNSWDDLELANESVETWEEYTLQLLGNQFSTRSLEYQFYGSIPRGVALASDVLADKEKEFRDNMRKRIRVLKSIIKRLPLLNLKQITAPVEQLNSKENESPIGDKVFVVHGHDEAVIQKVARLLEHLEIKPTILHEIPNKSRTIIEKLEQESKDACYAIVLLTADDDGKSKKEDETKDRARQNVVLELGYFIAKLGREKVCALYEEGVELPSDFDGVLYTPIDDADAWRYKLANELKVAGFEVDLNKIK